MRKLLSMMLGLLLVFPVVQIFSPAAVRARSTEEQEENQPRRVLARQGVRRRRGRGDRSSGRGIGSAYKRAGISAGRGGKRFGQNMARGLPVRAGKEFGKGMGGFGKHAGIGSARVGKRVGKVSKRALTP